MLGAPRTAQRSPRPGSAVSGPFQRHLVSPSSRLSEGISQHTPPAQNVAYPTQLSAAPAPFFPLPVHQRPRANPGLGKGKLLEGRVGTNTTVFQGGQEGNTPSEMNPPPGRGGSQGGGVGPRPRPRPVAASLLSSSQLPIVRTLQGPGTSPKERRLGRGVSGGYLPFFSFTVHAGSSVRVRAHARAHAHTH